MSETATSKALIDIDQTILKWLEEKTDRENLTHTDIEKLEEDWRKLGENTKSKSLEQLYSEMKEAVTKHLMGIGMSKTQAEEWVSPRWKDFIDRVETIRKSPPTVVPIVKKANFMWLKVMGGIAAVPALFLCLKMGSDAPSKTMIKMHNDMQGATIIAEQMKSFQVTEQQFSHMIVDLNVSSPPVPSEPMPIAVAAAAPEPVEVEVTASSGATQTITSTVGRVWESVPQARHEIEQEVLHLDHGYDHPDPRSCVSTDCLSQHPDKRYHREFAVDSPIGSAHFKQ